MKFARLLFVRSVIGVLAIMPVCQVTPVQAATVKSTPRVRKLVDLNHATLDELRTLPGIEEAFAAKIVKNRPYSDKSQLSTKGVISAATYARIRLLVIAKQ